MLDSQVLPGLDTIVNQEVGDEGGGHSLLGGQVVTATQGLGASTAWSWVVVVVTASSQAFLFWAATPCSSARLMFL